MENDPSLLVFPCDFPLKIIGKNTPSFAEEVIIIARKYFFLHDRVITSNRSQNGNYLAITITLYVQDQATLDTLYLELTKHPDIKMVL